ncbi:MAG TPA: DUF1343 domain-containing protein [Flavobacteriaceae bacterium]|nr:DUF1343 domain-containing protein [Flavobacteriaceae bacterium]
MRVTFFKNTVFLIGLTILSCGSSTSKDALKTIITSDSTSVVPVQKKEIVLGVEQFEKYLPGLKDKKVAVVANQTSFVPSKNMHLVDFLLSKKIGVIKVFAPEHGFRGAIQAGEQIKDGIDVKTGLPLISLYGKNKKPTPEQLKGVDFVIFDIQDVGARFYTYISTLHYVMEACAELKIPIIVPDRPNPNIHYIDGPVLEESQKSFIGMHPVPVVHGMTIAEYAQMINGEGWLDQAMQAYLEVIPMKNYTRNSTYSLPIKPSPNLTNDQAINLYPSTCFFEGTPLNEGRGTDMQFQVFGAPALPASNYPFSYTPRPNEGSKDPKFNGKLCHGKDLRKHPRLNKLNLEWLIDAYNDYPDKPKFFTDFFSKLAGTKKLQEQIIKGLSAEEIRATWVKDLKRYDEMRRKYFLY